MYKIYINETPLYLLRREELGQQPAGDEHHLLARYPGKPKMLLNYADMLEKTSRFLSVTLYAEDLDQLFADFRSHYKVIEAAGGLVFNDRQQLLVIFRHGHWDLPKGKIDPGERREAAALREVQEETGLSEVHPTGYHGETFHTYRTPKGRRVLKITYWYTMQTPEHLLVPQTEEDIEQAVWMSPAEVLARPDPIYGNIRDMLQKL